MACNSDFVMHYKKDLAFGFPKAFSFPICGTGQNAAMPGELALDRNKRYLRLLIPFLRLETHASAEVEGGLALVHVLPLVNHVAAVALDVVLYCRFDAEAAKEVFGRAEPEIPGIGIGDDEGVSAQVALVQAFLNAAKNVREFIEKGGNADPAGDAIQDGDYHDLLDQNGGPEGF